MTTNVTSSVLQRENQGSLLDGKMGMSEAVSHSAKLLTVIQQELSEVHECWSEQIAATVREDYRQLLRDFDRH